MKLCYSNLEVGRRVAAQIHHRHNGPGRRRTGRRLRHLQEALHLRNGTGENGSRWPLDHGKMEVFLAVLPKTWVILLLKMKVHKMFWRCCNNQDCLVFTIQHGSLTMKNWANVDLMIKTRKLGMVRHGAAPSGQHCIETWMEICFPNFRQSSRA